MAARTSRGLFALLLIAAVLVSSPGSGAAAFNTAKSGQVTCGTSVTTIVSENRSRIALSLLHTGAGVTVFFGDHTVVSLTTTTGMGLAPNVLWKSHAGYTGPMSCIVTTGTQVVTFLEELR